MYIVEHVKIVKQGSKAIANWRHEHPNEQLDLTGAVLKNLPLEGADLKPALCDGTQFTQCDLRRADLRGALVNTSTGFMGSRVDGCRIDRHTLESLTDYGHLSTGDRMRMHIVDGVATLRASYSGFLQWIHLSALMLFLFPYLWFAVSHWGMARFERPASDRTITLLEALGRYIWNGGVDWASGLDFNPWPFVMFVLSLAYNLLRFILLWKTKSLELEQEASGLPVMFNLAGKWGMAYQYARFGFWLNLILVALHTIHFLLQEIPLPS